MEEVLGLLLMVLHRGALAVVAEAVRAPAAPALTGGAGWRRT
jgi:hypothetical protein